MPCDALSYATMGTGLGSDTLRKYLFVGRHSRTIIQPVGNIPHYPVKASHQILSCHCAARQNSPMVRFDARKVQNLTDAEVNNTTGTLRMIAYVANLRAIH